MNLKKITGTTLVPLNVILHLSQGHTRILKCLVGVVLIDNLEGVRCDLHLSVHQCAILGQLSVHVILVSNKDYPPCLNFAVYIVSMGSYMLPRPSDSIRSWLYYCIVVGHSIRVYVLFLLCPRLCLDQNKT